MLKVKPIDEETINAWPIQVAGLPARAVRIFTTSGIKTTGELRNRDRKRLNEMSGLGIESIMAIDTFLAICARIQAGTCSFDDLHSIFAHFLTPAQYRAIVLRYNLQHSDSGKETLEQIGRKFGTTRERVRQVVAKSMNILSGRLCQACLSVIYDLFEDFITNEQGAVPCDAVDELARDPLISGYTPCNLLHMLCDCSCRIVHHNGLFVTAPVEKIASLEYEAVKVLNASNTPLSEQSMLSALSEIMIHPNPETNRHVITCLLRHCPGISSTIDERYFTGASAAMGIIAEILCRHPAPITFKTITYQYNQMMMPGSRKGSGFILDLLSNREFFRKNQNGLYEIILRA